MMDANVYGGSIYTLHVHDNELLSLTSQDSIINENPADIDIMDKFSLSPLCPLLKYLVKNFARLFKKV